MLFRSVDVVKSPMFATGVGLVQLGLKAQDSQGKRFRTRDYSIYNKVKGRMKEWLADIF